MCSLKIKEQFAFFKEHKEQLPSPDWCIFFMDKASGGAGGIVGLLWKDSGKTGLPPNLDTFKLKQRVNLSLPPILEYFEWKQHVILGKNSPHLDHGLGKNSGSVGRIYISAPEFWNFLIWGKFRFCETPHPHFGKFLKTFSALFDCICSIYALRFFIRHKI